MCGLPVGVVAALQPTLGVHRIEQRGMDERALVDDDRGRAAARRIAPDGPQPDAARAGDIRIRRRGGHLRQR